MYPQHELILCKAISTLLQPPMMGTGFLPHTTALASSASKPPTARDIPPVTLTNITHIDASEFDPYLSQISPLYEQLWRMREKGDDDAVDILSRRSHPHPGYFAERATREPPSLSIVPHIYFNGDFHLENPRTFDVVIERSEVVRPLPMALDESAAYTKTAAPQKALATNAILQENLSWHMDIIELYLVTSSSAASTAFFPVLGSLQKLHSEAVELVERTKALRKNLEASDKDIAVNRLHIIRRKRQRENLQQLHDAVLQLKQIVDEVAACESLVDNGEMGKALDYIDSVENLIVGKSDPSKPSLKVDQRKIQLRDLRGAAALQGLRKTVSQSPHKRPSTPLPSCL